jgi:hypothetical protein
MMASSRPDFLGALGEVGIAGLETYMKTQESERKSLEAEAVRVVTGNPSPELIETLERNMSYQQAAVRIDDQSGFHERDIEFHDIIFGDMRFTKVKGVIEQTRANLDRARRLILLAPAGMGHDLDKLAKFTRDTPVLGDWLMLLRYPSAHRQGTEAERALPSEVEGIIDYQQAELGKRGFIPAVLSSLRGILPRPLEEAHRQISREGIPVLAIWGREDKVIPLRAMGQLAQWNRMARHEVIDGAGHGLTYTHASAVLRAIEAGIAAEVTGD